MKMTPYFCNMCDFGYETWNYTSDTLIEGRLCQRIEGYQNYYRVFFNFLEPELNDTVFGLEGEITFPYFYTTQNDTTWMYLYDSFEILAVMNADVGDTWPFTQSYGNGYIEFIVHVDSISNGDYLGQNRRQLFCHYSQFIDGQEYHSEYQFPIIEGIHIDRQFLPRFEELDIVTDDPSPRVFICYSSDTTPLMQIQDDCMPIVSSLTDLGSIEESIALWPNPMISNQLFISVPSGHEIQNVTLRDLNGSMIAEAEFQRTDRDQVEMMFSLVALSSGLYLLEMELASGHHIFRRVSVQE